MLQGTTRCGVCKVPSTQSLDVVWGRGKVGAPTGGLGSCSKPHPPQHFTWYVRDPTGSIFAHLTITSLRN